MTTEILIPKLGFSVNEATLAEWMVADGASVNAGDPLFSIETEKAVEEIPAPCSGTLKILKSVGETYALGTVIGVIE